MKLNEYIDHTNLNPTATKEDIFILCEQAKKYCFHSVCVNPFWVKFGKKDRKKYGGLGALRIYFPAGAKYGR